MDILPGERAASALPRPPHRPCCHNHCTDLVSFLDAARHILSHLLQQVLVRVEGLLVGFDGVHQAIALLSERAHLGVLPRVCANSDVTVSSVTSITKHQGQSRR